MKRRGALRRGFSLIELIFVIVVLGIVASLGSEIIANVYKSYIVERAMYRATMKTELALNQIANRLRYAIPGTLGARADKNSTFVPITAVTAGDNKVLQWVAYDGDSFEALASDSNRTPGWSGFCDLDRSGSTWIVTPGSKLSLTDSIIGNLSGGSRTLANTVVYLPDGSDYNVSGRNGEENLTLAGSGIPSGESLYERYKLAWSSYALEVNSVGDLILHYNFTPTVGAAIANDQESLLLHNVSNLRFQGTEGAIRIKICKMERITEENNVTACKEKVIF